MSDKLRDTNIASDDSLEQVELKDVSDAISRIEHSFQISFRVYELEKVKISFLIKEFRYAINIKSLNLHLDLSRS